jgi:tetratricopeptide (TPR) repeat protein
VLDAMGALADRRGKHAEAAASLEKAALAGIAAGNPRATARSAIRLVYVVAAGLRKPAEVTRWIEMAKAALAAAGHEPRMTATLHDHVGVAHVLAKRPVDAIAAHRDALATIDRAFGPDHPDRVRVLINLATALHTAKRHAEALPVYEQADALATRIYGAGHPLLGPLLTNRAMVRWELADRAGVLADLERSLAVKEAAGGPDHPSLATTLTNLGLVFGELERPEAAVAPLERAIRIRTKALGAEHVTILDPLINLALTYIELGRPREAIDAAQRAVAIARATGTPGADVYPTTLAAWAELEAGRSDAARELVARADAAAAGADVEALERAHLDFVAARAIDQREPERARARALAALAVFRDDKVTPSSPRFARTITTWLETRGQRTNTR